MTSASDLYQGEGGRLYWGRNSWTEPRRSRQLRELYIDCAPSPWLEVGCGRRGNMKPWDIGLDIDPRNKPHIVHDVRCKLPFTGQSFSVVFCVGLLMHLRFSDSLYALSEMARVSDKAVIIGEYVAYAEKDLLWDYTNGGFGDGQPGLVWERPYEAPEGFKFLKRTKLCSFGDRPTFLVFERENS